MHFYVSPTQGCMFDALFRGCAALLFQAFSGFRFFYGFLPAPALRGWHLPSVLLKSLPGSRCLSCFLFGASALER